MRILYITILVVVARVTSLRAQNKSAIDQWIQKHVEAVTIYREGDAPRALALLGRMTLEEQEKTVSAIRGQMERIATGWPPRKEDVVPWTPRLLRRLGRDGWTRSLRSQSADRQKSPNPVVLDPH